MNKKLFCLILALTLSLTACKSSAENIDPISESVSESNDILIDETPVEKCDYKGEDFIIYAPEWGLYENYFFADSQTGEVMNDSIYKRKTMVEERLGITVSHKLEGSIDDQYGRVNTAVMSGDDEFQLILTHCITGVGTMITDGLLLDWNKLEYTDLSQKWWNQSANELLTLDGKLYYAVSDYMLADPNCILFNKSLVDKFDLDSPYDLVKNGNWIVDKLIEMSAAVSSDLNGDGMFDEKDRYGFASPANWMLASFYPASDIYLVSKDKTGEMKLTFYGDRTISLVEKLDLLFNRTTDAYSYESSAPEEKQLTIKSDRVLFSPESIHELGNYRDTEVDYGILPYPKFDATQENYISNDWSGLMGIPTNVKNPEMIGKAVELFAYYSRETTIPAYYDLVLTGKLSRDENSKEMLDIIFDNVIYDPGLYFFGWSGTQTLFHSIKTLVVLNKSGDIASLYKSVEESTNQTINTFLEKLP